MEFDAAITQKSKSKLQVIQNKIARFIKNDPPRTHIGPEELQHVKMLNVDSRVKQLRLNHAFNIYHGKAPSYMCENFTKCTEQHDYSTRNSKFNFVVPKTNAHNTFFFKAIKDWNSLPTYIKEVGKKDTFKGLVKSHLFGQML